MCIIDDYLHTVLSTQIYNVKVTPCGPHNRGSFVDLLKTTVSSMILLHPEEHNASSQ